jgi:hypothetical protein
MLAAVEPPPSQFPRTVPITLGSGTPPGGPDVGVPFEGPGGFFTRFVDQLMLVTTSPIASGRAMGGQVQSLGPSFLFATITCFVAYVPFFMCLPCLLLIVPAVFASALPPEVAALQGGLLCGVVAGAPFLLLGTHVVSDLLFAACFHGIAVLAGGTGTFAQSLRAMLYARGVTAWLIVMWIILVPTMCIPFLSTVLHAAFRAALLVWAGFTLFGTAQGVHGLNEDRSVLVSVGSLVAGVVLYVALAGGVALGVVMLTAGGLAGLASVLPH